MMRLIEAFRAWRHRREWPIERQLYRLRRQVAEDARWLSHNPVAAALTERYLEMLGDDWMYRWGPEEVSHLRERLGLDPHIVSVAQSCGTPEDCRALGCCGACMEPIRGARQARRRIGR